MGGLGLLGATRLAGGRRGGLGSIAAGRASWGLSGGPKGGGELPCASEMNFQKTGDRIFEGVGPNLGPKSFWGRPNLSGWTEILNMTVFYL